MKRWVCPTCNQGINAPATMKVLDVRKYCLDCSYESKTLVLRTCPSLEKLKVQKKKKTKIKKQFKKEIMDGAKKIYEQSDEFYIRNQFEQFKKLKCWRVKHAHLDKVRFREADRISGLCYTGSGRICITVPKLMNKPKVAMLLLHEIAHAAVPHDVSHGKKWKRIYVRAVKEAYGITIDWKPFKRIYELDRHIEAEIKKMYLDQIESWDWKAVKERAMQNMVLDEDEERLDGLDYLGSVLQMYPSGKIYAPWTTNQTNFDVVRDSLYQECLESVAEKHNMFITSGDGSGDDVFAGVWFELSEMEDIWHQIAFQDADDEKIALRIIKENQ